MGRRRPYLTLGAALIAVLSAALIGFAASSQNDASAARGEVTCKLKKKGKKRIVTCPKRGLRGQRGPQGAPGLPGATGPAGPPGATGGAGSNLNLNFNARLTASSPSRELTVGAFNVTAEITGGKCEPIRLRVATNSQVAIGSGAKFAGLGAAGVVNVTDGTNSNMFTAVSNDGGSTMSGIVGSVTVGNVCVVSGYVTGR